LNILKTKPLTDEEVIEECAYEESFQEYPDEVYHVEDQEENTLSYDPFEDLDESPFHDPGSEEASDEINQHIDTFIQIGKHGWDMHLFTFDEDATYDVEGIPQTKDDLKQCFQDDFQSPYSNFDRHQVVAFPKQSKVHTTKQNYFHVETLGRDLQTKKRCFLIPTEEFSSKVVPYPIFSCLGNHRVFFGTLFLSHISGSNDLLSEDEDEPSYSPLQIWIDQARGYACK
jgi:hypothetical protein